MNTKTDSLDLQMRAFEARVAAGVRESFHRLAVLYRLEGGEGWLSIIASLALFTFLIAQFQPTDIGYTPKLVLPVLGLISTLRWKRARRIHMRIGSVVIFVLAVPLIILAVLFSPIVLFFLIPFLLLSLVFGWIAKGGRQYSSPPRMEPMPLAGKYFTHAGTNYYIDNRSKKVWECTPEGHKLWEIGYLTEDHGFIATD